MNWCDDYNREIGSKINIRVLSFCDLGNEWTNMIEFLFVQIINKENFIFDFLMIFVFRIWRNANKEFLALILWDFSVTNIGSVLGGLYQIRNFNIPMFHYGLRYFCKIDLDIYFKKWHFLDLIKKLLKFLK